MKLCCGKFLICVILSLSQNESHALSELAQYSLRTLRKAATGSMLPALGTAVRDLHSARALRYPFGATGSLQFQDSEEENNKQSPVNPVLIPKKNGTPSLHEDLPTETLPSVPGINKPSANSRIFDCELPTGC